jgi:hypothetical protein
MAGSRIQFFISSISVWAVALAAIPFAGCEFTPYPPVITNAMSGPVTMAIVVSVDPRTPDRPQWALKPVNRTAVIQPAQTYVFVRGFKLKAKLTSAEITFPDGRKLTLSPADVDRLRLTSGAHTERWLIKDEHMVQSKTPLWITLREER